MGAYLSEPVTTKESASGSGNGHTWGCSSMQGWRQGMEDAHVTLAELGEEDCRNLSLYAVFDGHGGREVALFCQEHFPEEVRRQFRRRRRSSSGSSSPSPEEEPPVAGGGAATSSSAAPQESSGQAERTGAEDENVNASKAWKPGADIQQRARALIGAFHTMDELLRRPEAQQELLALKGQGRKSTPGDSAGAAEDSPDGEQPSPSSPSEMQASRMSTLQSKKAKGATMLQNSVHADLQSARQKGRLTKEQAGRLMFKMSLLKRLESADICQDLDDSGPARLADDVGCTAVCVVLSETDILCANAGDSRAVLCRAGRPIALSHDHKPNDEVERKRIEHAGGSISATTVGQGKTARVNYRINGNLNLSRSIGDLQYKRRDDLGPEQQVVCATPELHAEPRTPEDEFVVVACDGIWDVKNNEEVCRFIRTALQRGEHLERIVEDLLDACICPDPKASCGLGGDNMTCVVVQLQPCSNWVAASSEVHRKGGCLPFRCLRK